MQNKFILFHKGLMIETIIKINVVRKNSVNRLKDFGVMGYVPLPLERR